MVNKLKSILNSVFLGIFRSYYCLSITKQIMINLRDFSFLDLLNSSFSQVQPDVVFNIVDNDGNALGKLEK